MLRARLLTLACLSTWATCAVGEARADPLPAARLLYERGPGAGGCPDESAIRDTVAGRLGYDPFQPAAASTVSATITRVGRGLVAQVELRDAGGRVAGSRVISSRKNDCGELASAVTLAICIAIDPLRLARPEPAPPLCPPPISCPPEITCAAPPPCPTCAPPPLCPPPPPPPPPVEHAVEYRAAAGALLAVDSEPGRLVAGVEVQVGLQWRRRFSLSLEGRFDGPGYSAIAGGGQFVGRVLAAGLVPCAHLSIVALCGLGYAGYFHGGATGLAVTATQDEPWVAAGARVGLEVRLHRALMARLHGDFLALIDRTTLEVTCPGCTDRWTAPRLSGTVALDLAALF